MNKQLLLLTALTGLSAAGLLCAHCAIAGDQDAVTLRETPLAGSLSAAQNLTVQSRSDYEGHLSWDTTFVPGQDPTTTFSFSPRQETADYETYGLSVSSPFPGPYGFATYQLVGGAEAIRRIQPELLPVIEALMAETAPGETGGQILDVAQYTDTYPLHFWLELPDSYVRDSRNGEDEAFWGEMAETFRFPVNPDHRVSSALTLREDGQPDTLSLSPIPGEGVTLQDHSLLSDSGVWFLPELRWEDGTLLDYSLTPGYGVYHLALPDNQLDIDNLSLVYPLPADAAVVRLDTTPDGSTLLVTTRGTEGDVLHILPLHHPEARQSICLSPDAGTEPWRVIVEEDLLVCMGPEGQLLFLCKAEDGGFDLRFRARLSRDPRLRPTFNPDSCSASFDGTRLALVLRPLADGPDGHYQPNSFTLLTLEESAPGVGELTYAGFFSSSLDFDNTWVQDQLLRVESR